jgi:hypothetical protein
MTVFVFVCSVVCDLPPFSSSPPRKSMPLVGSRAHATMSKHTRNTLRRRRRKLSLQSKHRHHRLSQVVSMASSCRSRTPSRKRHTRRRSRYSTCVPAAGPNKTNAIISMPILPRRSSQLSQQLHSPSSADRQNMRKTRLQASSHSAAIGGLCPSTSSSSSSSSRRRRRSRRRERRKGILEDCLSLPNLRIPDKSPQSLNDRFRKSHSAVSCR